MNNILVTWDDKTETRLPDYVLSLYFESVSISSNPTKVLQLSQVRSSSLSLFPFSRFLVAPPHTAEIGKIQAVRASKATYSVCACTMYDISRLGPSPTYDFGERLLLYSTLMYIFCTGRSPCLSAPLPYFVGSVGFAFGP